MTEKRPYHFQPFTRQSDRISDREYRLTGGRCVGRLEEPAPAKSVRKAGSGSRKGAPFFILTLWEPEHSVN
jgi:hypothetical protein